MTCIQDYVHIEDIAIVMWDSKSTEDDSKFINLNLGMWQ